MKMKKVIRVNFKVDELVLITANIEHWDGADEECRKMYIKDKLKEYLEVEITNNFSKYVNYK